MRVNPLLKLAIFSVPLVFTGAQVFAQDKERPAYVGVLEDIDPYYYDGAQSSASGLDSPQATINVTVASVYKPITPCRLADTREPGTGERPFGKLGFGGLGLGTGETVNFWGWAGGAGTYVDFGGFDGTCGIPATATAIHVSFTVVDPKGKGYLRTWPYSLDEPLATIFAWNPGFGVTNAATISICSNGTTEDDFANQCIDGTLGVVDFWVKIYSERSENITIDAFGYYEPLSIQTPIP